MTLASNIQITLCLALALGLAACNEPTSGGSQEPEDVKGLKIIPVFGADRMDVTGDVVWRATTVGKAERVDRNDDNSIFWIDWAERFQSEGVDGVYPLSEGEIAVSIGFNNYSHDEVIVLSEPEDGNQIVEVPITGKGRLVLEATGLADNALVDLGLNGIGGGAFGGSVSTTGWRNHRGANYVDPGEWEVSLTNQDTGESHSETINIGDGESQTLSFTFSQ